MTTRYGVTLGDLEREVRVPRDRQVEQVPPQPDDGPIPPEELERLVRRQEYGG